ncbi:hypothetical protein WJX73_008055 [Symbiochloris irregularis]|uniref:Uncharacterized protein n=1 Tax=Symbiochloris irregularis TaxID=706552 RepID=A0AAW1Q2X1_9CHLO
MPLPCIPCHKAPIGSAGRTLLPLLVSGLEIPSGLCLVGQCTIELDGLRSRISRNGADEPESQLYLPTCQYFPSLPE